MGFEGESPCMKISPQKPQPLFHKHFMGGGSPASSSSSSSSEEDGDAEWQAAINSVANSDFVLSASNGHTKPNKPPTNNDEDDDKPREPKIKHYHIKARKVLDEIIEKSLDFVKLPSPPEVHNSCNNGGGIRLFRKAPLGIAVDPIVNHPLHRKKPRILPGEDIKEKSKKFKQEVKSVVVDGTVIMAAAREACKASLARAEAREAAAKAAAQREEERIAELKKARGEKWLPSTPKYIQQDSRTK